MLSTGYEAGCDDATFGVVGGVQYAEFDREADSDGQALISAMMDVRRAVPEAKVVHVEPDELLTMAEIAERLGRSRESIRLLIAGEQGYLMYRRYLASLSEEDRKRLEEAVG